MDLNSVDLPSWTLASLYPQSLVELGDTAVEPTTQKLALSPEDKLMKKALGDNRRQILIIVDYNDVVYIPDDVLNFLTGMLTACKLSLADVSIYNRHANPDAGYAELISVFRSKTVLLFGITPPSIGLPLDFPQFQVQSFSGVTYLYSASLDEVKADGLLKSKLWVCLRRIFGV